MVGAVAKVITYSVAFDDTKNYLTVEATFFPSQELRNSKMLLRL